MVEQTGLKDISGIWRLRTANTYIKYFSKFKLNNKFFFKENGSKVSIFYGIKSQ